MTVISALSLFTDITYLGDDAGKVDELRQQVLRQGSIPLIDYSPAWGFVFHTLYMPDGSVSKKQIATEFVNVPAMVVEDEAYLEDCIARALDRRGINYERQVRCSAGIADIVTPQAIIELKDYLSIKELFSATGQVIAYQQVINPKARLWIVGLAIDQTAIKVAKAVAKAGVSVLVWDKNIGDTVIIASGGKDELDD